MNIEKVEAKQILSLLCIFFFSFSLQAQDKMIRGKVIDTNGDPIIGVNVLEKGTSNGIITDLVISDILIKRLK